MDCTNESAKGTKTEQRNVISSFLISYFTASVNPSINITKSSSGFMILLISYYIFIISLFEIYKVNTIPAVTASFPLMFRPSLRSYI